MRAIAAAATSVVTFVMTVQGCAVDNNEPFFVAGDRGASTGGTTTPADAGLDGETDAGVDAASLTCAEGMGQTACDSCVYEQCCQDALACSAGTPCDALWTCTRKAGCLDPQASDFDTCAVAACPVEATESAVTAIEALATCIRGHCSSPCGG